MKTTKEERAKWRKQHPADRRHIPTNLLDDLDEALARAEEAEFEVRSLKSCMDQDESDDRLMRHPNADAMLRESLGTDMFNRLWGPGLEALGKVVDVALNREKAAEAKLATAEAKLAEVPALVQSADELHEACLARCLDAEAKLATAVACLQRIEKTELAYGSMAPNFWARDALRALGIDPSKAPSMGNTWCSCCKKKVTVEDTFPGSVIGCGPFCSGCRPWWDSSPTNHFGENCPHDGSTWQRDADGGALGIDPSKEQGK